MDLLRHLRFFSAVAETRHFGEAARQLGMTQPPLSQGLRRLEDRWGVRLFDRDARGVRITAQGRTLLPLARDLIAASETLVQRAHALEEHEGVRLGLAVDLGPLVPSVVAATQGANATVIPTVAGSVDLLDRLREGVLDVCVLRHPGVLDGVVAGAVHTLPQRRQEDDAGPWTEVDVPVAVLPRHHQPAAHDQFVDALRRLGHSGQVIEAESSAQRAALVAAGRAVTVVPVSGPPGEEPSDIPPLRVRVALRGRAHRRTEVDHDRVVAALDRSLAG